MNQQERDELQKTGEPMSKVKFIGKVLTALAVLFAVAALATLTTAIWVTGRLQGRLFATGSLFAVVAFASAMLHAAPFDL